MWRSSRLVVGALNLSHGHGWRPWPLLQHVMTFSELSTRASELNEEHFSSNGNDGVDHQKGMSLSEAKKLLRLANVEAMKRTLGAEGKEVIHYSQLLKTCESMGVARSPDEAIAFVKILDEAGVVLVFRDKVYLHPQKVLDLVKKAVPLQLAPENDPRREELMKLEEKKKEIDMLAHRQVRRILWTGLGIFVLQVGLFFRLTFWEFSWDVMEPIAFFTTSTGLLVGYAYFLFTSRDPTYQDLMKRLFYSRQRKLIHRHNFDINHFRELQRQCNLSLDSMENKELDNVYKD